ncbi:MAG: UvrD-helicase domain-containing protein [Coprobacter sp.]|nr:UvrD-helicase domain-containing protein [Coprobacter sp.]
MENFLQDLNESQQEAVVYNDGPSLVIAGAGSGKTRVLTYKIAWLLQSGYAPYHILALTFTNKAAREMKERIASLVGMSLASRLWMGTFHSIFLRILRANADRLGFTPNLTIYDTADSKSLIKSIIKEMNLDDKVYKPSSVQAIISSAKNALITPEAYCRNKELLEADEHSKKPLIHEIYRRYRDRSFKAGAMDFDDLLLYTNILFRDCPDVLDRYRQLFRFVLVDEYQDTNFAQHLIVHQLAKVHNRICVVGDDAQSIYSFRGANISNILHFKENYPGCRIFKLERNYRSTRNIVGAANSLIYKNKEQIRKQVYSENAEGSKIDVLNAYSDFEEGYMVTNRISEMKKKSGCSYNDFAILYRTNAQSRIFEETLRKQNIPYRIYGGLSFYQRKEIKDVIAYFRLAVNPYDEEALRRVINYPARGIGDTTLSRIVECGRQHDVPLWRVIAEPLEYALPVNNGTLNKIQAFRELIADFVDMAVKESAAETAEAIIRRSGILADVHADRSAENLSRQENLQELLNGIHEFCALRQEEGVQQVSLIDFLSEVSLATDQDESEGEESDKVTMMTVHASKGLEFKNVFVVGLEEDLFPSAMSKNSEREIEEERRLLYVAITRAEENCTLSYAAARYRNGQSTAMPPSRFLKDIDPAFLHFPPEAGPKRSAGESFNRFSNRTSDWNTCSPPVFFKREETLSKPRRPEVAPVASPRWRRLNPEPGGSSSAAPASVDGLRLGSRIRHERFGMGTVAEISGEGDNCKIGVEFDEVGKKQLLLKFAKFTIIK